MPLNSGKVTRPLKTTPFEAVKIKFGPQFFFSTLAMYVAYVFCKKNDQNRTNMSVVAAQTKHCHAEGVPTLYPVLASFQGYSEGYSNVLAPIPLGLSFRTDFFRQTGVSFKKMF